MEEVPIEAATRKVVIGTRLRREPVPKGEPVPEQPLLEQGNWTGIDLIDWISANLESRINGQLTRPPKGNEDLALLKYYRAHKDEFMKTLYRPALLKRLAGRSGEPPEVEDPDEELTRTIRELRGGGTEVGLGTRASSRSRRYG